MFLMDSFVAGASKTQEEFSQVFITKIVFFRRDNEDKRFETQHKQDKICRNSK